MYWMTFCSTQIEKPANVFLRRLVQKLNCAKILTLQYMALTWFVETECHLIRTHHDCAKSCLKQLCVYSWQVKLCVRCPVCCVVNWSHLHYTHFKYKDQFAMLLWICMEAMGRFSMITFGGFVTLFVTVSKGTSHMNSWNYLFYIKRSLPNTWLVL